jgi:hypothetical protein
MVKFIILLIALYTSAASADLIKIEFSGESYDLWEAYKSGNSYDIEHVPESNMFGFDFKIGESISGYYIYDTSVARYPYDHVVNDPNYNAYPSILEWGYSSANHSFNDNQENDYLAIYNDGVSSGYDMFDGSAGDFIGQYFTSLGLSLWDRSGTLWDSLAIPTSIDLDDFDYARFEGAFLSRTTGDQFHWEANVSQLRVTNVTQVNEPSSIILLCLTLLFLIAKYVPNKSLKQDK